IEVAEIQNRKQKPYKLKESDAKEFLGESYDKIYNIILNDVPKAPESEKIVKLKAMLERVENDLLSGKEVNYDEKIMLIEKRKQLSEELQLILANDKNSKIREEFAYNNRNLIPEVQLILAKDPFEEVRKTLAYKENLIPEVQMLLAKDTDPRVRRKFASKEHLIPEAQMLLAKDTDEYVRRDLAYNRNLIPEVQLILAKDTDWRVRKALSDNYDLKVILDSKRI